MDAFYIDMIAYPGELFMRLLKLMILPLVIASLIAGSASLNAKVGATLTLYLYLNCLDQTICWSSNRRPLLLSNFFIHLCLRCLE